MSDSLKQNDILTATTADINAKKSKVDLNPDGSDTFELQQEANKEIQEQVNQRLEGLKNKIRNVFLYLQEAPPLKLNGRINENTVNNLVQAMDALATLRRVNPDEAQSLENELREIIKNNENIGPWREEIQRAAENKREQKQ